MTQRVFRAQGRRDFTLKFSISALSARSAVDSSEIVSKPRLWAALVFALVALAAAGCYNNNTGETRIGGAISFKLPAFPESGPHAVMVFSEMHYQPTYRVQESPRLLPPPGSVPVTGGEVIPATNEDYQRLPIPARLSFDPARAQALYDTNCLVCHGEGLGGDGKIRPFMTRGPFPADLTADATKAATDGELFAFVSNGGRQGQAAFLRGRESTSPMPLFRRLLTEDERWTLVQYLRSR